MVLMARTEWNTKQVGKKKTTSPSGANVVKPVGDAPAVDEGVDRFVFRFREHSAADRALLCALQLSESSELHQRYTSIKFILIAIVIPNTTLDPSYFQLRTSKT